MSEYFPATAQAGNARLSWSDEVVVCLAGYIVREGRVYFCILRGWGREVLCKITEMTMSIKAVYFVAYAFY